MRIKAVKRSYKREEIVSKLYGRLMSCTARA
jgi:hypothetical protein